MSAPVVLVVDSSPQTAQRVGAALEGSPFSVKSARNADEAEAVVAGSEVAAVVAALTFPRGNGYDLARSVRRRAPEAAIYLLCGGFDIYNPERASEAGVTGRIARPVSVEAMRGYLEAALGPLADSARMLSAAEEALPEVEASGLEPLETGSPQPAAANEIAQSPSVVPAVGNERIASFLPRDWHSLPHVKVDPAVVAPALERAILAVLPEVVEVVLNKAIATSPAFREMLEVAVEEAVRQELPALMRKIVRERMAELESTGRP